MGVRGSRNRYDDLSPGLSTRITPTSPSTYGRKTFNSNSKSPDYGGKRIERNLFGKNQASTGGPFNFSKTNMSPIDF